MPSHIIVGLGNPGTKYIGTRHNLGFRVADRLAEDCSTRIRRSEYRALTALVRIGRSEVLLMKPQTYMNRSGSSVAEACRALGLSCEQVIVVSDEADLALGRLRVRRGGGTAGHRGLDSIVAATGERDFVRVRLGVGRPPEGVPLDEYLLSVPPRQQEREIDDLVERGAAAAAEVLCNGVEAAMRLYNAPPA